MANSLRSLTGPTTGQPPLRSADLALAERETAGRRARRLGSWRAGGGVPHIRFGLVDQLREAGVFLQVTVEDAHPVVLGLRVEQLLELVLRRAMVIFRRIHDGQPEPADEVIGRWRAAVSRHALEERLRFPNLLLLQVEDAEIDAGIDAAGIRQFLRQMRLGQLLQRLLVLFLFERLLALLGRLGQLDLLCLALL